LILPNPSNTSASPNSYWTTPRAQSVLAILLVVIPGVWLYGPSLWGGSFVFRDAAHFYGPLYTWQAEAWRSGSFPLWNPYENLGSPLAADPTASVFYPVKCLFLLPGNAWWWYRVYIAVHGFGAAGAAFLLARRWGLSPLAAALSAVAYAYGGSVFFQYCNLIYLAGAAWLPLAMLTAERMLALRSWRWSIAWGAVLAMIVLAGDPQTAYHAALLALLYAAVLRWPGSADRPTREEPTSGRSNQELLGRLAVFTIGVAAAIGLSAVQIFPSLEWSPQSDRSVYDYPRSIYEASAVVLQDPAKPDDESGWSRAATGLIGRPAAGTHHLHTYDFSVGPWRFAELLWPNFSGKLFPTHRRWVSLIPAADGAWTPSVYLGLGPLFLALSVFSLRCGDNRLRWMSLAALMAALASLGWFGLGWLWMEFRCGVFNAQPEDLIAGPQTGGLYWLLSTFAPGYAQFRFPAKWLIPLSLALGLLAGWGFDRLSEKRKLLRVSLFGFLALSGLLLLLGVGLRGTLIGWFSTAPADPLFGPLEAQVAVDDLLQSLLHAALVAGVWALLLGKKKKEWMALGVVVTAVELVVAAQWMAPLAPVSQWTDKPAIVAAIEHDQASPSPAPVRVFRANSANFLPPAWIQSGSPDRQQEGLAWDTATLYPKHNLPWRIAAVESSGSAANMHVASFLYVSRIYGAQRPDGLLEPHPHHLDMLASRYLILPQGFQYPEDQQMQRAGDNAPLWRNPDASAQAWIVHHVDVTPPLERHTMTSIQQQTEKVLLLDDGVRNLRELAVVEDDQSESFSSIDESNEKESCRILVYQPNRVEVEAVLNRQGLVILSDTFDPAWRVDIATADQPPKPGRIVRTDRIFRGVLLPEGKYRLVFTYRPPSLMWGAAISLISWLMAGVCFAVTTRSKSNP